MGINKPPEFDYDATKVLSLLSHPLIHSSTSLIFSFPQLKMTSTTN